MMKRIYALGLFLTLLLGLGFNAKAQDTTGSADDPGTLENYTLSPAAGTVKALSRIGVTFPNAETIEEVEGAEITLVGPEYNANASEVAVASLTKTVYLTFPVVSEDGNYTLTIPTGAFKLDGEDNEKIIANYTLNKGWTLIPAPGEKVESLSEFVLAFPTATDVEFVGTNTSFMLQNTTSGLYSCQNFDCVKVDDADVPTYKISIAEGFQKPSNGEYKFAIDEGTFTIDGEDNAEIYAEYTLEAEVPTEYTISPEPGNMLLSEWGINVGVIFDETANLTTPDSSSIKMTLDDTEIPSTEFQVSTEGNMLLIMINNGSQYNKVGTLKLEIPSGAFKVGNNDSPAISAEWEIVEPKTYEVEISAANGNQQDNRMSDMSVFILNFPEAKTASIWNEYGARLSGPGYNQTAKMEIIPAQTVTRAAEDGVSVKLTFNPAPSTQGQYNLYVVAGALTLDGVQESPMINQTYIYDANTGLFNYTLSPAAGTVKALSTIGVTFPNVETIEEVEGAEITLVGPEYNANPTEISVGAITKTATYAFSPATVDGDYTLTIPAGSLKLNGEDNEDIIVTYTLKKGWVLTPTPGETVESLNEFILEFPDATEVEYVGSQTQITLLNTAEGYAAPGFTCEKNESAAHPTFIITLLSTAQKPTNGDYRFYIEEGAFIIDGEESAEITAEYTLEAEISSEYALYPDSGKVVLYDWGITIQVIFDEISTITEPSQEDVKLTLDGEQIPTSAYMVMADYNNLGIMIYDPTYLKTGKLTLNIAAGAFKVGTNDSPAISEEWEVVEPKTFEVEVSTANGNQQGTSMSDMSQLILYFPEATSAKISDNPVAFLKGNNYNVNAQFEILTEPTQTRSIRAARAGEGVGVSLTFDPAPTAQQQYTLTVREGSILLDGVHESPEIVETYTYDITTGVWSLFADEDGNVTVYNLDGKIVLDKVPASQLRELEKGLYIINGKKTLVK